MKTASKFIQVFSLIFVFTILCVVSVFAYNKHNEISISYVAYNYTQHPVDIYVNGEFVDSLPSLKDGGATGNRIICCTSIPKNLKNINISWRDASTNDGKTHSASIKIAGNNKKAKYIYIEIKTEELIMATFSDDAKSLPYTPHHTTIDEFIGDLNGNE